MAEEEPSHRQMRGGGRDLLGLGLGLELHHLFLCPEIGLGIDGNVLVETAFIFAYQSASDICPSCLCLAVLVSLLYLSLDPVIYFGPAVDIGQRRVKIVLPARKFLDFLTGFIGWLKTFWLYMIASGMHFGPENPVIVISKPLKSVAVFNSFQVVVVFRSLRQLGR